MAKGSLLILFAFGVWLAEGIRVDLRKDRLGDFFRLGSSQALKDDPRCKRNGIFPIPEDCTSYLVCRNGKGKVRKCPKGFKFDSIKHCTPDKADCGRRGLMEPIPEGLCREEYGTFPYPGDCHKYVVCIEGEPRVHTCPEGEGYRPGIGCDKEVQCVQSESSYVLSCIEPNGLFPIPAAKNKYMDCKDGKLTVKECPKDQIFDPVSTRCVKEDVSNDVLEIFHSL